MSIDSLVDELKQLLDKRVRLVFSDGEAVVCDLQFVIEEDDSVVFELVSSNRPGKYEGSDIRPTVRGKISEIIECCPEVPRGNQHKS